MTATPTPRAPSQCAWCCPPGSPSHDPDATHGMCPRHARETLLLTPLLAALATLRGPAYMGEDDRASCARFIDTVVTRLCNEKLIHLFAEPDAGTRLLPEGPSASPQAGQRGAARRVEP